MRLRNLLSLLVVGLIAVTPSFIAEAQSPAQQQQGHALAEQYLDRKISAANKKYEPAGAVRASVQKMSEGDQAALAKRCKRIDLKRTVKDYDTCYAVQQNLNLTAKPGVVHDWVDWAVFGACIVAVCVADECSQSNACGCHCLSVAHQTTPACHKACG